MSNKIRYAIIFLISLAILGILAKTISIAAYAKTNYTKVGKNNLLGYSGSKLQLSSFAKDMGGGLGKRKELLNTDPKVLLGAGFYNNDKNHDPIDFKSTICLVHNKGNKLSDVYRISTVIDVNYDDDSKCVNMTTSRIDLTNGKIGSTYKTRNYAAEISYTIKLNQYMGSDSQFTKYKSNVDYYLKKAVISGDIKANSKFGERSDSRDNPSLNLNEKQTTDMNNYSKRLKAYQRLDKNTQRQPEDKSSYNLKIKNTPYTVVGPFNLKFTTGMNSIEVNGSSNNSIEKEDGNIYWVEADNDYDYSDPSRWGKNWGDIPSKKWFYLAVKTSLIGDAKTYKIIFHQKPFKYYRTRMLLLESSQNQQFGTCIALDDPSYSYAKLTYKISRNDTGSLVVQKVDAKGNGLSGVGIKVYGILSDDKKGWVKSDGTIDSSFSNGKTFKTGSDGKVTISKLKAGEYYVYEVSAASGYDLDDQRATYPNSKDPNKFAGNSSYGKCVYLGTDDVNGDTVEIKALKQYTGGNIIVEKVDKNNAKLAGVQIKIYGKCGSGKGWLKSDGSLADSFSSGDTFVTDSNGKIEIKNAKVGTYYIYEVGVPAGYNLEEQRVVYKNDEDDNDFAGDEAYGKCVYLGKGSNKSTNIELKGLKQYTSGSITIEKVSKDDANKKISGVKLKIYAQSSGGNGWLKEDGTITSSYSGGSTFVTGSNGTVEVKNVPSGTYYVYEIGAGDGYNLEDQRTIYTDDRDPNEFAGSSSYGNAVYLGTLECEANDVKLTGIKQYPSGALTIEKVDSNNASKKISDVKIKVYGETEEAKGWVKADGSLADNYSEGETFTTGSNGIATVAGIQKGTYYVYEIGVPNGYDLEAQRGLYPDSNDPNQFAGNTSYGKGVYLGKATCDNNSVKLTGLKQVSPGTITIEKVNQNDSREKVSGVKIKIYGDTSSGKGWLKKDGTLASDYSSGYTYETNGNGLITVEGMPKGTYYIYEIEAGSGYNLEDQRALYPDSNDPNKFAGNASYGNCVYLTSTQYSSGNVSIKGIKQSQAGSLTIEKVDANNTSKKISGVKIKIYGTTASEKGWLKEDGTFASDYNSGSTFETDEDGTIAIESIRSGTYYIYEIEAGSGYELEGQRSHYPDSRDPNRFAGNSAYGNAVYLGSVRSASNDAGLLGVKQYQEGSITIEKVNANNTRIKIRNVGIKVYGVTDSGNGWVREDGTLATDYGAGSTFLTDWDGQARIEKLKKGTYYFYEISTPDGYDKEDQRVLYPDSNDPNKFAGNSSYGNSVYLGSTQCDCTDVRMMGLKQNPEGKIIVEKVNSKDTSKKISGVKFKIYGDTTIGKGWVKADGTVQNDYSAGNTYTSGSDGKATIDKLRRGTYYIYEIDVPKGYDLEDQRMLYPDSNDPNKFAGSESYDDCVYLTTTQCNSNTVNINAVKQKEQTPRDLMITKIDKNKNEKVSGTGFKVLQKLSRKYRQNGVRFKENTYVWIKADGSITENVNEAGEFKTLADGIATVKNILTYGTCYVYEVTPGGDFELIEQEEQYLKGKPDDYNGTFLSGEWVYGGSVEITTETGTKLEMTVQNEHTLGSLTLVKKDATYRQDLGINEDITLKNAKVKLYGKVAKDGQTGWVQKITYENGKYKYGVGPYSSAEEFTTDDQGRLEISRLRYGTYYIYETQTPDGYNIKKQNGYHQSNQGSSDLGNIDWVYLGEQTVNYEDGEDVTYEAINYRYITEIKGKVWLDEPDTKANLSDNIYNSSSKDRLLSGITVELFNGKTGAKIATTVTNDNGEYIFNESNIGRSYTYWEAAYSYVEFTYDNTKYITVNPFEGGINSVSDNSKAQEEEISQIELDDKNLSGTTGNVPGKAITLKTSDNSLNKEKIEENAKKDLSERLLTGYYNDATYTIENINLGLIEKVNPDHAIGESLEYVKIQRGNYTFKYKYGDEAVIESDNPEERKVQSSVKFQNSKKTFTQSLYPSDIKYNIANGLNGNDDKAYKVYVVYKIDVKNTTTLDMEDLYKEQSLHLNSLTNNYDTSRFELSNAVLPGDDENISRDFSKWTGGSGTASYDINDSNKKFISGIGKGETETVYIEFKVTDDALNRLVTEKELGESPTKAKSIGYHTYTRKDKNWKNKDTYTHISNNEERENGSLYLKWNLFDTRTISGCVFEDSQTTESQEENTRVGDGKFDGSDKTISSVLVSLIDAESETGETAYLYEEDLEQVADKWTRCKQKAIVKADDDGNYSLKGVIPGRYYLKFTYGDGKTRMTDLQGNPIDVGTKIKGESNVINSNYYKSTILTGPASNTENENWFLSGIGDSYSVATDSTGIIYYTDTSGNQHEDNIDDIIAYRTSSDKEMNYTSGKQKFVIDAISPNMNVQFEYIPPTADNKYEYQVTDQQMKDELQSNCTGMCFGIIERPHVEITLEKTISSVVLTLSDGSKLVNDDLNSQDVSQHMTKIDGSNAKIEVENSLLYGSEITVDYNIKAINESELDYATREFYTKGTKGNDDEIVKTTVTKIVDYVSNKDSGYKTLKENANTSTNYNTDGYEKSDYFGDGVIEDNKNYSDYLLITKKEDLVPKSVGKGQYESDYLVSISRLLPNATTKDNLGWDSFSEIIGIKNVTYTPQYTNHMGSYIAGDRKPYPDGTSEKDNADSTITITAPTGENRSYTMYIVSACALMIVGVGVVMIKKFVL